MFIKFLNYIQTVLENAEFAFFAAIAKALLQPLESRAKTITTVFATAIIGTALGEASLNITWLKPWAFSISTVCGLFGRELFDYALEFIKNREKLSSLFIKKM